MLNKKWLLLAAIAVLVLGMGGVGLYVYKANTVVVLEDDDGVEQPKKVQNKEPPVYVPLENLIVNLSDPGAARMLQLGITVVVDNGKTQEKIKQFLPSIRSNILMITTQYTSDDILSRGGKEKLRKEIGEAIRASIGVPTLAKMRSKKAEAEDDEGSTKEPSKLKSNAIQDVLFTDLIVQ